MIHVLKITGLQGVVGEDGLRDQSTGSDVRMNVFTYGAEPTVSGGLPPFTFTCSGAPAGTPNGQYAATAPPGSTAVSRSRREQPDALGDLSDHRHRRAREDSVGDDGLHLPDADLHGVRRGGDGYGGQELRGAERLRGRRRVRLGEGHLQQPASRHQLRGQGYDSGETGPRWGYFEGVVGGTPQSGQPLTGTLYATLTDAAGRSQTVGVTYNWTPGNGGGFDYYDCTPGTTMIAYVDAVYASVHDKYGSGFTKRIYQSCGSSTDPTGYTPNNYAPWGIVNGTQPQGPKYGTNFPQQYVQRADMDQLVAQAANWCAKCRPTRWVRCRAARAWPASASRCSPT